MKKLLLFFCLITFLVSGQNYKFGKVSKKELEEQFYPQDSSANAAILFKKRRTYFQFIQGDGFSVITEVHERIKIYNKEGYDWATKELRYYTSSTSKSEKIILISAKTYALQKGKIKSYKFKKGSLFVDKENKYWSKKIFTMPNLTEGCVVEWKYKLISPYKTIDKLNLQYSIPVKKIVCKIEIPEYYLFNMKSLGFENIETKKSTKRGSIIITNKSRDGGGGLSGVKTSYTSHNIEFVINVLEVSKDFMPALKKESYVSNIDNYSTSIKYELSAVKWPNEPIEYFSKSWDNVAKTILYESSFGGELHKKSYFKKDLALLIAASKGKQELRNNILNFVKKKVKWNGYNRKYTDKGVRYAYKNGTGNIAEINFILIAMLREAGITANPVLVSTRSHGIPIFPTIDGFNYVLAGVEKEGNTLLLDASEKYSIPNVLPFRTLNWKGRIIRDDKTSNWLPLIPVEHSKKEYLVSAEINDDLAVDGFVRVKYSNKAALEYRKANNTFSKEELLIKIDENYTNIDVSLVKLFAKEDIYKPIMESFKFTSEDLLEEINGDLYVKPLLFLAETTNPFKMDQRVYPIDYGTPWTVKYRVSLKIPENYQAVSIPESEKIVLDDGLGYFVFKTSRQGKNITVQAVLSINKGVILASNYVFLKEFYNNMLKKVNEKIVLKKV